MDVETDGGSKIDAILLLHPFHTIHVPALYAQLPHAKLYGTKRHVGLFPALPWEPEHTEDAALHGRFANDQVLSVPRSIELVSSSSDAHFGSVLAFHRASHTLHVDDTIVHARHLRDRTRSRRPRSRSHRSHDHARRRVVRERARCLRRAQTSVPRVALE